MCLSAPLFAQSAAVPTPYVDDFSMMHRLVDVERDAAARQSADRKDEEARKRQVEFVQRVEEFANSWNALLQNSNKGVWNPKQAKAVRKAFERLTRTEGWMEEK